MLNYANATLTAVNKKHQKHLEKAYKAIRKYHDAVNAEEGKIRTDCERLYDKFCELRDELPKREQAVLQRYHMAMHGYEAWQPDDTRDVSSYGHTGRTRREYNV